MPRSKIIRSDQIYLQRFAYLPEGTLGQLLFPGGFECFTIERPWRNNTRYISCIPEGSYPLRWHDVKGKHFGQPALVDVPSRSGILIHIANYPTDVLGCIGPGQDWKLTGRIPQVTESKLAYTKMIEVLLAGSEIIPGSMLNKTLIVYSITATLENQP